MSCVSYSVLSRKRIVTSSSRLLHRFYTSPGTHRKYILTEKIGIKKNVGLISLNRPKLLNTLCDGLIRELGDAVEELDNDKDIATLIITGIIITKAFAAGGDLNEVIQKTFTEVYGQNFLIEWQRITQCRKPLIAAVNGYAFGGGCELANMCDIIYSSDTAKFGQLEILVGLMGGTQRISRVAGKSTAMEMCLTGKQISAQEAERVGLVSKVFPEEQLLPEVLKIAEQIGEHSQIIVAMTKEAINRAYELTLQEGLLYERLVSQSTFATKDRFEGMTAFIEKRRPKFQDE